MNNNFATNGILVLWLGAVGLVIYKEFGNTANPSRPLPRPCKLIPPAIGYTGLGFLAQFMPTLAFMVALGLTVSEVVNNQGLSHTIFDNLANSIAAENQSVAKAG